MMLRLTSSGALGGDAESHLWEVMLWVTSSGALEVMLSVPQSPGGFRA